MSTVVLHPGDVTLSQWRAIYAGGGASLDAACGPRIEAITMGFSLSSAG